MESVVVDTAQRCAEPDQVPPTTDVVKFRVSATAAYYTRAPYTPANSLHELLPME